MPTCGRAIGGAKTKQVGLMGTGQEWAVPFGRMDSVCPHQFDQERHSLPRISIGDSAIANGPPIHSPYSDSGSPQPATAPLGGTAVASLHLEGVGTQHLCE